MKNLLIFFGIFCVNFLIIFGDSLKSDLRLKYKRKDREDGKPYDNQLSIILVFDVTVSKSDYNTFVDTSFTALDKLDEVNYNDLVYSYILVLLNDSYESKIIKRRKMNDIKYEISKIKLQVKKNCTKSVLTSVLSVLDDVLPKSIVFVFTDGSANDTNRKDQVFRYIDDKNITIHFFLTGFCTNKLEEYSLYNRIAKKSKGRLNDLNQKQMVMDFLQKKIDEKQTSLEYFASAYKGNFSIPFNVDSTVTNLSISITGNDIEYTLLDPSGTSYEIYLVQKQLPTLNEIIVNEPIIGKWNIIYESSTSNSIKIFHSGLLSFKYGFSQKIISDFAATTITPHKGKNILCIFPSNSSLLKDLDDIELELCDEYFDMESEVITFKLPLLRMDVEAKEMFYRTELFSSPNIAYKIYINGYDYAGNLIRRLLSSHVTPTEAITIDSLPEISIEIKHYNSMDDVQITCRVISLAPINVQWLRHDVLLKELDSEHSAELNIDLKEISEMLKSKTDKLKCFARSMNGEVFSTINIIDIQKSIDDRVYKQIEKESIIIENNLDEKSNEINNIPVNAGDIIELNCYCYKCDASDNYRWIGNNVHFSNVTPDKQENMFATRMDMAKYYSIPAFVYKLNIEKVMDDDTLECQLGELATKFNLIVNMKPIPELFNEDIENNYNVKIGETLSLDCSVKSKPKVIHTWYKNGNQLTNEYTNKLFFNNITLDDDGNYKCEVKNYLGKFIFYYNVTVLYKPQILMISNSMSVLQDSEFSLECKAKGNPLPTLTWTRERKVLLSTNKIQSNNNITDSLYANETIYLDKHNFYKISTEKLSTMKQEPLSGLVNINKEKNEISFKLSYKNMSILWANKFSCFATNDVGRMINTTTVSLLKPPEFLTLNMSTNIETIVGVPLQLSCESVGYPKPTTKWLFNDNYLNKTTIKYFKNDQIILLKKVNIYDEGHFTCVVTNEYGTIFRNYIIDIMHKPHHFDEFTKQRNDVGNQTLLYRDIIEIRANFSKDIVIECPVSSKPLPLFHWSKVILETGVETKINTTEPFFKVYNIQEPVTYKCVAENKFGVNTAFIRVIVQKPPTLRNATDESLKVIYGKKVILDCELEETNLKNDIFWYKYAEYIYHKNIYAKSNLKVIKNEEKLVIFNVTKADEGEYLCYATNKLNYTSKRFNLSVSEQVSWSRWTPWSPCSATCGAGIMKRIRSCLLPDGSIAYNKKCDGKTEDLKMCFIQSCFIDDDWTDWSEWSQCSKSCINEAQMERSIKQRSRHCNVIEEQFCGYKDIDIHAVECNVPSCPRPGWSPWGEWSQCSATCGSGKQVQKRFCQKKKCKGANEKYRKCFLKPCDGKNQCQHGYRVNTTANICEDIDECNDHPCVNNELCINLMGSFHCILY